MLTARKAYHRTHQNPLHAYATYAYGYTLYKRGNCKDGISLMQASLSIQPARWQSAVQRRITSATKRCARS